MIDHDRLFKELITIFFVEFVEGFLPELASYLERDSFEFLDKELFTGLSPGERREPDLVIRARFRGQAVSFVIHLEHQAQTQPAFARRMFWYFAHLDQKLQMPIYPIALFSHDGMRREPDFYQVRFPDWDVLRFTFQVIQLTQLHWRDYVGRPNPAAAALMAKMGMSEEERPQVKLECLRMLTHLDLEPGKTRFLSGFVDTYLRLSLEESLLFQAEADRVLNPTEKSKVIELTTSWKEEGLAQGRQEGRQEGREEGRLEVVLRQLRRRCGPLPSALETHVRELAGSHLEELAEALLDFNGLADLQRWLQVPSKLR
jgi:hypothetical protein